VQQLKLTKSTTYIKHIFLYGQTTVKLKHHTINTLFFYIKSHHEKPEKKQGNFVSL